MIYYICATKRLPITRKRISIHILIYVITYIVLHKFASVRVNISRTSFKCLWTFTINTISKYKYNYPAPYRFSYFHDHFCSTKLYIFVNLTFSIYYALSQLCIEKHYALIYCMIYIKNQI